MGRVALEGGSRLAGGRSMSDQAPRARLSHLSLHFANEYYCEVLLLLQVGPGHVYEAMRSLYDRRFGIVHCSSVEVPSPTHDMIYHTVF